MQKTPLIETELVDDSGNPAGNSGARTGATGASGSGPTNEPKDPTGASTGSGRRVKSDTAQARTGFHPMSVGLLLVVDNLWALADWVTLSWFLTIPLSFITVFLPTLLVQRRSAGDPWSRALLKALFLGAVAAVPTFVTGTTVGLALLAWAGVKRLRR